MDLRGRLGLGLGVALGALGLVGCGRVESAADRHAVEMRESLGDITAEQDKDARRFELEASSEERHARPSPGPRKASSAAPPSPPRTVQLGEGEEPGSDDPNDPGERPEIKLHGAGGGTSSPSRTTRRSRREAEEQAPPAADAKESR